MAQCTLLAATLALLLLVMPCLFGHVGESPRIIASQTMENNTICASACAVSKPCNWPVFDTKNKLCHFIKCPVNTVCQNITVEELLRNEETGIQPDSGDMFMFPISSVPNISLEVFPVNSSFLTSSDSGLDNTDTIFDEAMENSTFSMTSASGGDVSTVAPSDHALNQEPTAQNDSPVSSSTTITTKPTTISFTTSSTTMFYTTKSTSTTVKLVTEISLNTTSATEQKTEMTDVVNTLLSPSPTISMTTTTIPKMSRPATSTLVTVKKRPSLTTVRTINGPAISMSSSETLAAPPRTSAGKEDGSTNKAILDVAAGPLTRQLVDTSSLLAVLLFGLIFFLVTISLFLTKAFDSYKKRDYTQIDYLINGMYSDSGV